jgi:hypothetical protein
MYLGWPASVTKVSVYDPVSDSSKAVGVRATVDLVQDNLHPEMPLFLSCSMADNRPLVVNYTYNDNEITVLIEVPVDPHDGFIDLAQLYEMARNELHNRLPSERVDDYRLFSAMSDSPEQLEEFSRVFADVIPRKLVAKRVTGRARLQ